MADDFNVLDQQAAVEPDQLVKQFDQEKTEDGENFVATDIANAIADTASQEWLVVVGSEPIAVKATYAVEGKTTIDIFEGTLVSSNGAPTLIMDANRTTGNTPLTTVHTGPTITNDGTKIAIGLLQAGEKEKGITSTETGDRIILKASTNYLMRLTNKSGGTIDMSLQVDFNEPA